MPAAKVIATDVDRKVEYPTQADASGRYIFPTLPTATYTLTVEAPGFRKATRPAFRLEVQQQATVDIALVPIFDPTSTFIDANGATMRNPIPGNVIAPSRQNKIVQAFNK